MQARTLLVRSQDRDQRVENASNGFGSHKGRIQWGRPLQPGLYQLQWATIPNSVYNVTSSNNQLRFANTGFGGGVFETVVLPPKNYTAADLATALSAASVLTWTYDADTYKMTVSNATGFDGELYYEEDSLLETLGFERPDAVLNSTPIRLHTGIPLQAPQVVKLAQPLSVGIQIAESSGRAGYEVGGRSKPDGKMTDRSTEAFNERCDLIIPYLSPAGTYSFLSSDVFTQGLELHRPTQTLSYSLINLSNNKALDLNGANWEMMLQKLDV